MKTNMHLWYLAQFFLEWEMFQTEVVEKIKTHILCPVMSDFHEIWYKSSLRKVVKEVNFVKIGSVTITLYLRG
jgi:hypothetical protein